MRKSWRASARTHSLEQAAESPSSHLLNSHPKQKLPGPLLPLPKESKPNEPQQPADEEPKLLNAKQQPGRISRELLALNGRLRKH